MGKQSFVELRCPTCHSTIEWPSGICRKCGTQHLDENGYLNFVNRGDAGAEKAFYDQHYQHTFERESRTSMHKKQVEQALALWDDPWKQHDQVIWRNMSDVQNKRILLLGNGESDKELAFLKLNPAALIYSDLSSAAVKITFERYDILSYSEIIRGAAIDAVSLPFHDGSLDVVYGYAMVHHLPNVRLFLTEVYRVLAPGGKCVFFDDAFAPAWQYAKLTILRSLMRYSHRKTGISPEDLRFSMSGGFRETDLASIIESLGGEPWFERSSFLAYIVSRGIEKLLPAHLHRVCLAPGIGRCLNALDHFLAPLLRANFIRLAWGFAKQ